MKTGAIVAIVLVLLIIMAVVGAVIYVQIQAERNSSFDYQIMKAEEAMEANEIETAISFYDRALELDRHKFKS